MDKKIYAPLIARFREGQYRLNPLWDKGFSLEH